MKKTLITFLILVLLSGTAYGAAMRTNTLADAVELSVDTTDTGWLQSYVANADRVAYFVTLDSSSTTQATTSGVTIQASADGTNWTDIKWFDLVGGTTAQVEEALCMNGDETYMMWLDKDIAMPHLRLKVFMEPANWDTQTLGVTITIVEDK